MSASRDCLALSFELQELDPQRAEAACQTLGAFAVTFSDAHDDAVLEPAAVVSTADTTRTVRVRYPSCDRADECSPSPTPFNRRR